jgi:hypothetical protein
MKTNMKTTMKTLLGKTPKTTLALFGALLMTTSLLGSKASASVIYSQDFPLDGNPLLGTTSTVGGGTWSGSNLFNIAGYTTGDGGAIALAFTPQSGLLYELTATINIGNANDSWIGAGFLGSISDAYGFFGTPDTSAAIRNGDAWTTFPGTTTGITSALLRIRLDTTEAQWKTSYFQGDDQIGSTHTYALGALPTINYVGFVNETGVAVGSVSSFQLTAIPEPSTYALFLGGITTLLLIRRQRVQA